MSGTPTVRAPSAKSLKIDAIRFMAALWVMLYHFGPPPFKAFFPAVLAPVANALWSGSVLLFAGPAAVIVFFVISGYCIHNAYHHDATLRPINYFASRYVRIGLPLAAVAILCQPLGNAANLLQSVLWSLYCEIAYYTIYPLLRSRLRYVGEMIVGVALTGAAMVWYRHTHMQLVCAHCVYENYGVPGTAFLYLPGWLLGCLIAETHRAARDGRSGDQASALTRWIARCLTTASRSLVRHLAAARIAIVAAGSLTFLLASTSHIKPAFLPFIGPDITLPVFQFVVAGWLAAETAAPGRSPFWRYAGALGAWSYSLYLCHKLALAILGATGHPPGQTLGWLATVAVAIATSYAFYCAVERPSHRLAHRLRKFVAKVPTRPAV
jgi:peptidoglycan/LPS O-acetylase OafA/YrhL